MSVPWWLPFGRVAEVGPEELREALGADNAPQILDVRTRGEFVRGHIEGAVNVPVTELRSRLQTLDLDRDRRVVAVCLSAHRSPPAVRLLRGVGYDAIQLGGGMIAWRVAGLPEVGRGTRVVTYPLER